MEKSRALKKLKENLPASPSKRCAVISTCISRWSPESPTVLNLRKSISPVDSVIASNIQEIVESAKLKRSKEVLTVMNTVTASVSGENLEKSRCKMQLCKQLGIPARRISGGKRIRTKILKSESSAWNLTLRKTRRDAISDETKRIVYDFWLSPGISHPTGNKSDIKRERLGPNIYASHMAQVIEETQTDAYIDFVANYPDIKIRQKELLTN